MDPIQLASIEADLRKFALSQAAHDHKGGSPSAKVVADAETYFAFLSRAVPGVRSAVSGAIGSGGE